jgi:hypothetical protein
MKNWCKIIETKTSQILVTKDFDVESDAYRINVRISHNGFDGTTGLGYRTEARRDEMFESIPDDRYLDIAKNMHNYIN